jgi:branched-chain amino acid transport system ATP-binding protein/branched-chain amino acid transport system permease protein
MYWVDITNQVLIFFIFAVSLNLLMGIAGQVSIAHSAFGAIGGYAAAYLSVRHGWSFFPCVAVGMGFALAAGLVVSLPALRLTGDYLILLTLAVQAIILVVITGVSSLGGQYGLVGIPTPTVFGMNFATPNQFLRLFIVLAVIVYVICALIARSRFGLVLRGIREDQLATQSLGKNVYLYKVAIFGITAAFAGLAGLLLAYYNGTAAPGLFGFDQSIAIVAMVVIGGSGNLLGSLLGAIIVVGTQPFFEKVLPFSPEKAALVRLLFYGITLIVIMRLRPQGLLPEGVSVVTPFRRLAGRIRGHPAAPAPEPAFGGMPAMGSAAAASSGGTSDGSGEEPRQPASGQREGDERAAPAAPAAPVAQAAGGSTNGAQPGALMVEVRGLSKAFGGIRAVQDIELTIEKGKVTGLIGPNGAGKTTIFNLITGAIRPDAGKVLLRGEDITGRSLNRIATRGMVRSFQDVRVYANLTPLENVMLAVRGTEEEREARAALVTRKQSGDGSKRSDVAMEYLDFVGLSEKARYVTASLPFGEQKLVALARVLAAEPDVLLLDEPASGIDKKWIDRIVELVAQLRDEGLAICLVEHNLEVVRAVADRVYFLESGAVAAEGTMDELSRDQRLIEAYFGATTA